MPLFYSVHVPVNLLQERMERRVLRRLNVLHQLSMLGDQLSQVGQLLQQLREEEGIVTVVGHQMKLQSLHNTLLESLHQGGVH